MAVAMVSASSEETISTFSVEMLRNLYDILYIYISWDVPMSFRTIQPILNTGTFQRHTY